MIDEEALKLLDELNLDPDMVIAVNVTLRDMLTLNELIEAARAWVNDDEPSTRERLTKAVHSYLRAEEEAAARHSSTDDSSDSTDEEYS